MHGIERDESAAGDAEFGEKRLCRWNFVGLLGDIDMRQHECGVGCEGAQHLYGGAITELIKAATQCFTVERDAAFSGRRTGGM